MVMPINTPTIANAPPIACKIPKMVTPAGLIVLK